MIPAEATATVLRDRGHHVTLVTDPRGDAYPDIMQGFDRHVLKTSGIGGGLLGKVKGGLSLMRETMACRRYLTAIQADLVIGFGGYPSMPALTAAKFLKIPFVLHEQNTVLGRVNRLMAPHAVALALAYEETKRVPDGVEYFVTGNPVRATVLQQAGQTYQAPASDGTIKVMIIGGSQGARILSNTVPMALTDLDAPLRDRLHVTHQARPEDKEAVSLAYKNAGINAEVESYFLDIPERLADCHLVISRAGASTLAEITTIGVPSLLVPLKIAMDDHQLTNANILKAAGAAQIMTEDDFTPTSLKDCLTDLLGTSGKLLGMAQAAKQMTMAKSAEKVADMIEQVSKRS